MKFEDTTNLYDAVKSSVFRLELLERNNGDKQNEKRCGFEK